MDWAKEEYDHRTRWTGSRAGIIDPAWLLAGLVVLLHPIEGVAADQIQGTLVLRDALTAPGKEVQIEARLGHGGLLGSTGLGGERLELMQQGRVVASAMTGGDGRAFFQFTPRMRGNHAITVHLAPNPRVHAADTSATLSCWERRRPILLVEIATLYEPRPPSRLIPSFSIELGGTQDPVPVSDAAGELKRFADFYFNILYLVRPAEQTFGGQGDVRGWLRDHGFPAGFATAVGTRADALSELLDRLKGEGWDNVTAGIGSTRTFAETLVVRRIQAVILPASDREEDLPKKARAVKSWKEVREKLTR